MINKLSLNLKLNLLQAMSRYVLALAVVGLTFVQESYADAEQGEINGFAEFEIEKTTATTTTTTTTIPVLLSAQEIQNISNIKNSSKDIQFLKDNLCADPNLNEKKKETEASACVDCEAGQSQKNEEVEKLSGSAAKALAKLKEQERINRELAFYRIYKQSTKKTSFSMQMELDKIQAGLEEYEKAALKNTTDLEKVNSTIESFSKIAKLEPLTEDEKLIFLGSTDKDLKIHQNLKTDFEEQKNTLQKIIDEAKASKAKSAVQWAASAIVNQITTYDRYIKDNNTLIAKLEAIQAIANKPSEQPLSEEQTKVLNEIISQKQQEAKTHKIKQSSYSSTIDEFKKSIALKTTEMKALKKQEEAAAKGEKAEEPNWDEKKATLQQYEDQYSEMKSPPCGLSKAEKLAIIYYTGSGYEAMNPALRSGGESAEKFKPYVDVINAALEKFRPYDGSVKRGGGLPLGALEEHQVGAILTYNAYTSTSVENGFNSQHRFVIKSKTGRYLAPLSNSKGEEEVLFKPGTRFKVLSREDKGKGRVQFIMEEVTPNE